MPGAKIHVSVCTAAVFSSVFGTKGKMSSQQYNFQFRLCVTYIIKEEQQHF